MQGELTANGEIVIYPDGRKLFLAFLGACGFVILSIVLIRIKDMDVVHRLELAAVGVVAILFFGSIAIYCVYRLLWWRPAVVIGPSGITDNASLLGIGHLPWSDVESVVSYTFRGRPMLGIVPRDLDGVVQRLSWWKRHAIKANLVLGCAPVNLPQVTLPGTTDDLAKLIASRFGVKVRLDA
jgi:hypothetical protein